MEPLELLGAGPLLTICKERTVGDALRCETPGKSKMIDTGCKSGNFSRSRMTMRDIPLSSSHEI